ncbi:uncharacterized protein LOC135219132 isoform X2 [Macrobrachium nipponense]|uniref:uncharacterized protein LOC135219132 isoform X2 n=1 Tax=Macrobrachium nipponense TaxID=159736 RepID=UPI0030C8A838
MRKVTAKVVFIPRDPSTENEGETDQTNIADFLHFVTQGNSSGIPGVIIPDPLSFPDEYEFSNFFCTMKASDNDITGFSRLSLEHFSADFGDLSVHVEAKVPQLSVLGSATLATGIMFSFSSQYNVTFNNVTFFLNGEVAFDQEGALQMSEEKLKLHAAYEDLQVTITELLWIPEYVHEIVVDQLMPTLLDQTEQWILQVINENFRSSGFLTQFPDSVHFIDYLFMQARPQIRKSGIDPLSFDESGLELDLGLLLQCEDVTLKGLSSLYWGHEGLFTYIEDTFQLSFQVRTQALQMNGRCGVTIVPLLLERSLEIEWITLKSPLKSTSRVACKIHRLCGSSRLI